MAVSGTYGKAFVIVPSHKMMDEPHGDDDVPVRWWCDESECWTPAKTLQYVVG
jgi:hypothetical protein